MAISLALCGEAGSDHARLHSELCSGSAGPCGCQTSAGIVQRRPTKLRHRAEACALTCSRRPYGARHRASKARQSAVTARSRLGRRSPLLSLLGRDLARRGEPCEFRGTSTWCRAESSGSQWKDRESKDLGRVEWRWRVDRSLVSRRGHKSCEPRSETAVS